MVVKFWAFLLLNETGCASLITQKKLLVFRELW